MTTFTTLLGSLLRADPGRPLVTYYDHATGERVELSVTTYANWVAKAASLLSEEHDLERGQGLHLDLPTHWLGPVFLGAAWTVGLVVTTADEADAVVCGPDGARDLGRARRRPAGPGLLAAADGRAVRRPAAPRRARRRDRGVVAAGRLHRLGPAGPRRPGAARA